MRMRSGMHVKYPTLISFGYKLLREAKLPKVPSDAGTIHIYLVKQLSGQTLDKRRAWYWLQAKFDLRYPNAPIIADTPRKKSPKKVKSEPKRRKGFGGPDWAADRVVQANAHVDGFYASQEWQMARYGALKRAAGSCECCGATRSSGTVLHVDHIKPRSLYPEFSLVPSNLQVLCYACNYGKGNWDDTDWRGENVVSIRRR